MFGAADLNDYRRTLAQHRDQVRKTLEGEYPLILHELVLAGGRPADLVDPVLSAVLTLDELHDRHRERVSDRVPLFLEVGFRTVLDQLYRTNRIPDDRRRMRFVRSALVERMGLARDGLLDDRSPGKADLETLELGATQVDLVASGTFSSDGDVQHVSLTLENPRTGSQCNVGVTAPLEEVPYLLAEKVFQSFQAVEYPEVRNPNPHLTWIRPPSGGPVADPEQARFYCSSQGEGVRLPFALELINAAQVGVEGASYVEGGIPRLGPGPWVVADQLERQEPYYYFEPRVGSVDNNPAGAVRSGAGLGEVRARYWCVKGPPSPRVSRIEGLYRLHRSLSRVDPHGPALSAIQYLLTRENALSARARYGSVFSDEVAAREVLERACLAMEVGETEGVAVAGLTCRVGGIP